MHINEVTYGKLKTPPKVNGNLKFRISRFNSIVYLDVDAATYTYYNSLKKRVDVQICRYS